MSAPKVTVIGAWCPNCGTSMARLSAAQKRILAAIWVIERENAIGAATEDERKAKFVVKSSQIEDRTGLHHSTVVNILPRLRQMGYIDSRKGYVRAMLLHRLSDKARADPFLMDNLKIWTKAIMSPDRDIRPSSLFALSRKDQPKGSAAPIGERNKVRGRLFTEGEVQHG